MASGTESLPRPSRVSAQGALLFSGFAAAQALSFARNAMLGHALSPRDFGIAASLTLLLQLVETLSDLGHDRLIVQATDGDSERFLATTHSIALARGIMLALVLWSISDIAAEFFAIPEAAGSFALLALVPLIKGFAHLDCRRAQRRFDNRPQMLVEIVPQATAFAATVPLLFYTSSFQVVVFVAIIQAAATIAISFFVSGSRYALAIDGAIARRLLEFGWPILLSALPLVAVYQGDRAIIGKVIGIEALAAYSAAFMLTMVPGLVAARAGHALMLPLFSQTYRRSEPLSRPFMAMSEATSLIAGLYLVLFVTMGGQLVAFAFGAAYADTAAVAAWLAGMWSLRMLQAVPGMALMAAGQTKPFLIAGLIRAAALPFALSAALNDAGLAAIAAVGVAGEACSLAYVAWRVERLEKGLGAILLARAAFLAPAAITAGLVASLTPLPFAESVLRTFVVLLCVLGAGIGVMPSLLAACRSHLHARLARTAAE